VSTIKVNTIQTAAGTGSLTVPAESGTVVTTASPSLGRRNLIINGAMRIDQRNSGASVSNTGSTIYALDRFKFLGTSSAGVFSIQQDASAPVGFTNSAKITVTTTDTSLTGGDRYNIHQPMEGYTISNLAFGTASAKTVTLSFWVRSSVTGTFGGALQNGDSTRSYPFTYAISVADTWEYKTVTIPGDTSGTWGTDAVRSGQVFWALGCGPDRSGTAGAWASANYQTATGATNLMAVNGATFYLTGVQLEVGSVATPFEHRSYGEELALCQRYYEKSTEVVEQFPLYKAREADRIRLGTIQYKVTKRATPTIVLLGANGDGGTTPSATSIGVYACRITSSSNADSQAPYANGYTADAEL
jgi:hypothetical protein